MYHSHNTWSYRLLHLLSHEMADEIINELLSEVSQDPPESDVRRQKLIECFLTGNSKQNLEKAHTKEQIKNLSAEKGDNFSVITNLSSWARW